MLAISRAEEIRKEHGCVDKALLAAAVAFGGTFIPNLPPQAEATDANGYVLDAARQGAELLKNPGVRAVILTDTVNVARGLAPAAADLLDLVPGLDVIIAAAQVGYGAYEAIQAYKETLDQCMGPTN